MLYNSVTYNPNCQYLIPVIIYNGQAITIHNFNNSNNLFAPGMFVQLYGLCGGLNENTNPLVVINTISIINVTEGYIGDTYITIKGGTFTDHINGNILLEIPNSNPYISLFNIGTSGTVPNPDFITGTTPTRFLREDCTWDLTPGTAGSYITSVGLTTGTPWLTISGSPLIADGNIAINGTSGLTANQVLATPDGTTGPTNLRALVANDIPSLAESKITNLTTDLGALAPKVSPTFTGTVTLPTTLTGILKASSGIVSTASAGTDYLVPTGSGASLTGITTSQISNLSSWAGSTAITTLGTITTGTWSGNVTIPTTGLELTQYYSPVSIVTESGGVAGCNLSLSNWFLIVLNNNLTLNISNPTVGQGFIIILQQAASGGPYSIASWFSGITWLGSSFTAPTMVTTNSAYMVCSFKCLSSGVYLGWWSSSNV